jgi:murein DD-endopeptidase MepM/ murein hydrolase activator NlpD
MERRIRLLAIAALALAPLMAACTPESPETALNWNANDRLTVHHSAPAMQYAERDTARTYVYQGDAYAVPAPKPRPAPPAYEPSAYVPSYDRASGDFAWPLSGKVISGFGTTSNGERNDGINIATQRGEPIHASATGTVTYAGDELKGYGNLLLIKHANGYVTAYAHADRLIVSRGDTVSKGQVIGYSGSTGDVSSPQLHFEIRRDTTPVDPRNLLMARNS